MKALILAAGLGTRLAPYSLHTPKPLFTIGGRPILDLIVDRLAGAGCREVIVNTHHLHEQIEAHVAARDYPVPVRTRFEPQILGTGGAVRNVADFWGDGPLLVYNADILCDIDLAGAIRHHYEHRAPVTMVMHDCERFNAVGVDDAGWVKTFDANAGLTESARRLAFTGIHILEPAVLGFIPPEGFAGIIEAYARMLANGLRIRAFVSTGHYWQDIGRPEDYRAAAFRHMAPLAFEAAFGRRPAAAVTCSPLYGDGSDRGWFRLRDGIGSMILADHGIRPAPGQQEADAFVAIGTHLRTAAGQALPRIYLSDTFAGLVFVEDLGDTHLQAIIRHSSEGRRLRLYRQVIDSWLTMAVHGARGFDPAWGWQSARYDREVILQRECRYFCGAFVANYLGWPDPYPQLAAEFEQLADDIEQTGIVAFMHRDLQSRNIMVQGGRIAFIDFQGGRLGPLQYDLASLLIDPYASLSFSEQEKLVAYAARSLARDHGIAEASRFESGYRACALSRNLQILGAFAFLSRVKGKAVFESFIPAAAGSLRRCLDSGLPRAFPGLQALAVRIFNRIMQKEDRHEAC